MNWSGHSRHKSHSQHVQCTRPSHCQRQQGRHNPIQHRDVIMTTQRTLLGAHVNGTEIVLKSTDRRSNIFLFLYVQGLIHGCLIVFISRVIRWNCFSEMWRISLPRMLQNNVLQCYIAKDPEGLDSDRWIPLRGGPSRILATPRVRDSPIWIQPRGVFRINPTPGSQMSKNYAIIIHFMPPLTTFYRSGAHRSDVYKWDAFVTSWRF